MSDKPVLAIDYDDVLFPFMECFVPHYNELYGADYKVDDYWSFEFQEIWGGTREAAFEKVAKFFNGPHGDINPVDGAKEAVDRLSQHFELAVVTARQEEIRDITEQWLHETFPDYFGHVHLCNLYSTNYQNKKRTKLEVVEELDAVALIDDSLKHTAKVAASGRKAFLFGDYAWNRADTLPAGVERHLSWKSIVESLVRDK